MNERLFSPSLTIITTTYVVCKRFVFRLNTNDGREIHDKHSIKQWREKNGLPWLEDNSLEGGEVAVKLLLAQELGSYTKTAIDFAVDQILGKVPIFEGMVQFLPN
ncbi:hypothetical protein CEXT_228751 [Caerostris extrusa]|uniref:Uncharacterized protein n=1 Tax=Caerostris extrusa TaxID=172846 RepID=A0AAV4Q4U1_CAEEX|nr:hypothetical protein CEXT_228751 [Caerostris extrusa]